mgnify:CR=1 FL=1
MRLLVLLISILFSVPSLASWQLDNENSLVNFTSTKKGTAAEVHTFDSVSGSIASSGAAKLIIDLNSVNTKIEVRDTRMKEMLFETAKFTSAEFVTNISQTFIADLAVGTSQEVMLQGQLSLHGEKKSFQAPVYVTKVNENKLLVVSIMPIIIDANDFALTKGIAKLQEIAGLDSISTIVPVNFILTFSR